MKWISLSIIVLFAMGCTENAPPTIDGSWQSASFEDLGNGTYGKRVFYIGEKDWEVKFTLYFAKSEESAVFTFRGNGTYFIAEPSENAIDAYNANFAFDSKHLTLHSNDTTLIKNFGFDTCGLKVGNEQDISKGGCSFLESKSACAMEFDLVKIQKDTLYLGARPTSGNMCSEEKRPMVLGLPLIRL